MKQRSSMHKPLIRIISMLLSLVLVISTLPTVAQAAVRTSNKWSGIASGEVLVKDTITAISNDVTEHEVITNVSTGDQQRIDYITEITLSDDLHLEAGYGKWDASKWSLTPTTVQAAAYEEAHPGKTVVAAINADFFNMATGEPLGALVMDGKEYHAANGRHYFGVTKSGKAVIRNTADLSDLQMAVGGDTLLVQNGNPVVGSFAYGDLKYSRTCIGIKEDGSIVTFVTYGLRAPISCGRTYKEVAEMLANAGCVTALALDGGGSATYCSRPEGSDKLAVRNSPADGAERAVSSSLLIVSSAESTGVFDHTVLAPNNELYTPGSRIQFTAKAVDTAGMSVEMPADITWALAEESKELGTVDAATGLFTAGEKTGSVVVNQMQGDTIVGTTSIELVTPDHIYFANEEVSLGFEETTNFGIVVRSQGRDINIKAGDLIWTTTNEKIGTFNGNSFTSSDGASLNGNVTATSKWDSTVSGSIHVIVGMLPTIVWDFEDKTLENGTVVSGQEYYIDGYTAGDGSTVSGILTHSNYGRGGQESIEIITIDDDEPVRFGSGALKLNYDFINCGSVTEGACVGYSSGRMEIPGVPTGVGVWVYAPEGMGITYEGPGSQAGFWLRGYVRDGNNSNQPYDFVLEPKACVDENGSWNGVQPGISWEGWRYLEADLTHLAAPYAIQSGMTFRLMYVAGTNMGTKSAGSVYFDNLQFVYGTNVDDVDAPKVDSIMVNDVELENGTVLKDETLNVKAMFHDVQNKYTSGVDVSTVRMYVDGVNVVGNDAYEYAVQPDGTMNYLYNLKLEDGPHTITVSLRDGFGNDVSEIRSFTVDTGSDAETSVEVKPLENAAIIGKTVTLAIQANSDNVTKSTTQLRLGNLFPDYEVKFHENFDGTYSYSKSSGLLTITATRKETAVAAITEDEPTYNIAEIIVQVPATLNNSASFTYEVKGGSFNTATGFYATYYAPESSLPVDAAYKLSAKPIIVDNKTATISVTDNTGKVAAGVDIYLASDNSLVGTTDENGNLETDKFSAAAGVYQIYAKDTEGMISFLYNLTSYDAAGSEDGLPYDVRFNHTANSATSKSITWLSGPLTEGKQSIQYTVSGGNNWTTLEANSQLKTFTVGGNLSATVNNITLTGLTPATNYTFKVGSGDAWSKEYSFTTADGGDSTKFFVISDIQAEDITNITSVVNAVSQGDYDFGIQTGDAVDNATTYADWREIMDLFNQDNFGDANLTMVLGNHEYSGDTAGSYAKAMYNLPDGSMGSHYSFTSGNVYVAVINYTGNSAQLSSALAWLKADAQASDADWKVLAMHQPPYYTNATGGNAEIQAMVPKAAQEAGIDVVFSGHDHSLARTNPLTDGEIDEEEGILYYIGGSTGEKSYSITSQSKFDYDKVFALATLDFTATYLTAESTKHTLTININDLNKGVMDSVTLESVCMRTEHDLRYDAENNKVVCAVCGDEEENYTGNLPSIDDETKEYYLLSGEIQSGWVTVGEEIQYYNPETFIREEVTIKETPSTCIIDGHCLYTSASGEEKRVDYNDAGGHEYDESLKCTKCGHVRVDMEDCKVTLSYSQATYNGKSRTPSTTAVAPDGTRLVKTGASDYPDYYSTYANNTNVGTATVTLTARKYGVYVNMQEWRGNYAGSITVPYTIHPAAPSQVRGTDDNATLIWDAGLGADSYVVFKSVDQENWTELGVTSDTSFKIAPEDRNCYFKVRSRATVYEDSQNKVFESLDDTIANPVVTASNNQETGKPVLRWKYMAGADHYEVFRSRTENGTFTKVFDAPWLSYTHSSATPGSTYYYKVRAVYDNGACSMFSSVVSCRALYAAPTVTLSADTNGLPLLKWDAVEGAESYIVYCNGLVETTVRTTTYLDEDVESGNKYTYTVVAVAADKTESAPSKAVSVDYNSIRPEPEAATRSVDGKPVLIWDKIPNAVSYSVYRSTTKNGTFARVFTTTGTSYTHVSAEIGRTYYYKVKALFPDDVSATSAVVSATCKEPSFKVNTENREDGKPRLTWDSVEGATSYQVYRSNSSDGQFVRVFTTTGTSYSNTSAVAGNAYYYKVKVIFGNGTSAFGPVVSETCKAYTFTISGANRESDGKPRVLWQKAANVRYEVYRSESSDGTFVKAFTTKGGSYTNTSAVSGKTYYYKVKAILVDKTEVWSNTISGRCSMIAPTVTTGHRESDGKPTLSWTRVAGASKYEVYRSTSENGTFTRVFTTAGRTYTHSSATPDRTYYYKVLALSADGTENVFSTVVSNSYTVPEAVPEEEVAPDIDFKEPETAESGNTTDLENSSPNNSPEPETAVPSNSPKQENAETDTPVWQEDPASIVSAEAEAKMSAVTVTDDIADASAAADIPEE